MMSFCLGVVHEPICMQATSEHYAIGLKILNQLVSEMNQVGFLIATFVCLYITIPFEKVNLNADVSSLEIFSCNHNESFVNECNCLWSVHHYSQFDTLVVKS